MHSYYWKYEVIKNHETIVSIKKFSCHFFFLPRNYFQMKCHQSLPVVDGLKLFSEYTFEVFGNHEKNDSTFFAKISDLEVLCLLTIPFLITKSLLFSSQIFMCRWSVPMIGEMSPLAQWNLMLQFFAYKGTLSLTREHPVSAPSALSLNFSTCHTFLLDLLRCSRLGVVNAIFPQNNCSKKKNLKKQSTHVFW